ncbi:serine/threonine protein kinase [Bacillus sp. 491mf]|uniref:serine/threonine protein kinase n=1 Tax=Bacillus sp. 491mf TaxID=1761755 RepID=UPI0008F4318A|nr:protein kinase [Bacillus sp. 491mf]SFC37301.1 serine/threonine protein kinase [Bacillus sp. 491mf]
MNFQKILAWIDRPLSINTVVAQRYQIHQILGMGSYGFTYLVSDLLSGEKRVLKQLRKSKQCYASGRKSFTYEQTILQQLEHHAIPRFFHSFTWRKGSFFVMEEMRGKTFEDFIFDYREIYTEKEVFLILYKVLQVVSYFHSHGIVHRDLRIPNILMNDDEISVIDFGLARFIGENDERAQSYKGEQAHMREIHYRSDFYALGHFVLFLLYSSYESSKEERPWYEELTLSANSSDVIMRMLQMKEPYYENVQELLEDVRCIIERVGNTCSKSF